MNTFTPSGPPGYRSRPPRRRRRALRRGSWVALGLGAATAGYVALQGPAEQPPGTAGPTVVTADIGEGAGVESGHGGVLDGITVIDRRAHRGDYLRARFGDSWTDNNDAPGGHNGCDTRNDILRRDLTEVTVVDTSRCPDAIATGVLADPYAGGTINFVRGQDTSALVQIDHLVPLAYAWDMGAAAFDDATRVRFANDPANLLAVDGTANQNKRDNPPGRWMPSNEAFHCQYVEQFATVIRSYRLQLDAASAAVIETVDAGC